MKAKVLVSAFIMLILALSVGTSVNAFQISDSPDTIYAVAWSPDGSKIAFGGGQSGCSPEIIPEFAVTIVDAITGNTIYRLLGHQCNINSLAWNSNGTWLASAAEDGIIVWNVANGQIISEASRLGLGAYSVAWQPNGIQFLYTLGEQPVIEFVNSDTGQLINSFFSEGGTTFSADWSPDGSLVASGDNAVRVWDMATGQLIKTFTGHSGAVFPVLWSPDGTLLASVAGDNTVRIWNVATNENLLTIPVGAVWRLDWSPSGNAIAASSLDGYIYIFDTGSGEQVDVIQSMSGAVLDVDWSPDGSELVYVGDSTGNQGENLTVLTLQPTATYTSTNTPTPTRTFTPSPTRTPGQ
jgi:WD40 repeat protein